MWRRFSSSSSESKDPPPPPPPPSTLVVEPPKPATSLAATQQGALAKAVPANAKEHDLPVQRPIGAGQRRRSSILERLTRESTKEGTHTS